ncbi:MAG: cation:dicarboxylase symporter family transporter [Acidobacteria bacterium]|nr:cation:dicarboxylase symporter family transporter [Acidobacteriota bacterium]
MTLEHGRKFRALHRTWLIAAVAVGAWATAAVAGEWRVFAVPAALLFVLRWIAVCALVSAAAVRRSLTTWILVAMVAGAVFGHDWPQAALKLQVLSAIFLRMIKVIIAPLLFATLVGGIAGHPELRRVGRIALKAIIYFEVITTLALFIGLAAINLSQAGAGVNMAPPVGAAAMSAQKQTASDIILHIFPENIAKSVAENQVLQVVVFSIVFGIALALVEERKRRVMVGFCESLAEVMFRFTNIVMLFAPVGVGAAIAYTVANTGMHVLFNLAKLLATFYVAVAIFALGVLLPVALLARIPLRRFLRAVAEPASIAFATTSSEAALPRAMESMEAFGVPRATVAFVIPTGYSFNLDGASLYLTLASVFVAQAAGIHMALGQQLLMLLTLMLTSKGVAGVSRGSLVVLFATLPQLNLPYEPALLLLGVDQLMDMVRTTTNVVGNCLASAVVARWEGELGTGTRDEVVARALAD